MYGVLASNSAAQVSILLKSGKILFLTRILKIFSSLVLQSCDIFLSENPKDFILSNSLAFRGNPLFRVFSVSTILFICPINQGSTFEDL